MMGLTGASASDFDKALGLLMALGDPEAMKARIAAIQEAEMKALDAMQVLELDRKKTEELRLLFERERDKRIANLDAREAELAAAEDKYKEQRADLQRDKDAWVMVDAALKDDRKKLEAAKQAHEDKVKADDDRIYAARAAIEAHEARIAARDEELNARELALIDKETSLAERLKLLNEATRAIREG